MDTPTYNPKFSPPQSQDAFGIETGIMDGIITAMNVMLDQMNNHSTLVVNELKDQREKNLKFMEKVVTNCSR